MNITDYFPKYREVGYTKKTFGVNGRIKIQIQDAFVDSISSAKHCFFMLKGCMVPYFIDNSKEEREDGIIKFESTTDPETAKVIVGRPIYLHEDQVQITLTIQDKFRFSFVKGKILFDGESEQEIGTIIEIEEYPQQEMLIVQGRGGQEYMIPIHKSNYKGMDKEGNRVFLDIPEGLLDL